jgi:hypothetical protein
MSTNTRLAEIIDEPVNKKVSIVVNIFKYRFHASQYIRIFHSEQVVLNDDSSESATDPSLFNVY